MRRSVADQTVSHPSNSYVETLTPNVTAFEDNVFRSVTNVT